MEEWRLIRGYENYEVSSKGRVRNNKTGRILRPGMMGAGYEGVMLYNEFGGRSVLVHRLVAKAFLGTPYGKPEVIHLDGDRHNNTVYNLAWTKRRPRRHHAA